MRQVFEVEKPVTVGDPGGIWDLRDPAHDAAEFLTFLGVFYHPVLDELLRSPLPPVLDGVEVPRANPGEVLYNGDGSILV